jgi:hypothetical protein
MAATSGTVSQTKILEVNKKIKKICMMRILRDHPTATCTGVVSGKTNTSIHLIYNT